MVSFFKFWSKSPKVGRKPLTADETRIIDGYIWPRLTKTPPNLLLDQATIDDFRAFCARHAHQTEKNNRSDA